MGNRQFADSCPSSCPRARSTRACRSWRNFASKPSVLNFPIRPPPNPLVARTRVIAAELNQRCATLSSPTPAQQILRDPPSDCLAVLKNAVNWGPPKNSTASKPSAPSTNSNFTLPWTKNAATWNLNPTREVATPMDAVLSQHRVTFCVCLNSAADYDAGQSGLP